MHSFIREAFRHARDRGYKAARCSQGTRGRRCPRRPAREKPSAWAEGVVNICWGGRLPACPAHRGGWEWQTQSHCSWCWRWISSKTHWARVRFRKKLGSGENFSTWGGSGVKGEGYSRRIWLVYCSGMSHRVRLCPEMHVSCNRDRPHRMRD